MFEYIRTHQRLMQFLLLIIIFPSFAFFGIESYTRSQAAAGSTVATVAGNAINQQEFDGAMRDQLDKFRQSYGPQFDSKMMNTPQIRESVLDELISRKVVTAEVNAQRLTVSNAALQQNILAKQGLLKDDGSFDNDRYASLLASRGLTKAGFEQLLRQDLALEQLIDSVQKTAFLPKTVLDRLAQIGEQERVVQVIDLKSADFASKVKVSDEMIKAYYDKNAAQFEIPETVKAEYVVLSAEQMAAQTEVSDADVQAYYAGNSKAFTTEEQRRASHILISAAKSASDADKQKARAKAEALLAEIRKNPASFAKLAKENSQDTGSAEKGGDLDYFGKGAMVKPFEDAAFQLKKGEVSNVVQSEYGFHIIELTDIRPAAVKPLDEVRNQIVADLKKQKSAKAFSDAQENFGNMLYEQSDSLKPVADKFKLKIETAEGLNKEAKPGLPPSAYSNNAKFLAALFADDSVKKKHNTEAIEVAPNVRIAGRVLEYKPASRRPLEEVKPAIVAQLTAAQAAELAEKDGQARLEALKKADSEAGFSAPKTISRAKQEGVPAQAVAQIFKADARKLPAFVGVSMGPAGYQVYRISKVQAGAQDLARRVAQNQQMNEMAAGQDLASYIELLKKKAKVSVNKNVLNAAPKTE